jgi:hypothetical protein
LFHPQLYRVLGDLERLLPVKTLVESDHSDYRFRAYLDRGTVAGVIAGHVAAIDYEHGFKDRTLDRRRLPYLYSVWEIMATMQDDLLYQRHGTPRRLERVPINRG